MLILAFLSLVWSASGDPPVIGLTNSKPEAEAKTVGGSLARYASRQIGGCILADVETLALIANLKWMKDSPNTQGVYLFASRINSSGLS